MRPRGQSRLRGPSPLLLALFATAFGCMPLEAPDDEHPPEEEPPPADPSVVILHGRGIDAPPVEPDSDWVMTVGSFGNHYVLIGAELEGFEQVVWFDVFVENEDGDVLVEQRWHIQTVPTEDHLVDRIWSMRLELTGAEECFGERCIVVMEADDEACHQATASVPVYFVPEAY